MRHAGNRMGDGLGMVAMLVLAAMIPVMLHGVEEAPRGAVAVDAAALPHRLHPPAPGRPWQVPVAGTVDLGHGKAARLRHAYAIEGRVLTRRRHRFDAMADVSPLDLGIVTGRAAEAETFAHLHGSAVPRMALLRVSRDAPGWMRARHAPWFTNNHLIPATDAVRAALLDLRPGDPVRLEGFLADVWEGGEAVWRSSERRDDTWCEIVVVTGVSTGDASAPRPPVRRGGRLAAAR